MYQAMANAPIVKVLNNAELEGVYGGGASATAEEGSAPAEKEPHKAAFYAGLRAGASLNLYSFQTAGGYDGGLGRSFSGEAALLLEFHPFRFFSVQAEAVALYEKFGESREIRKEESVSRSTGVFTSLSLQIPILLKAPITLGRLSLAPFAGAYFILPLWPMTADFGGGNSASYSYRADPPVGLSLGFDIGLPLPYGKVFMGLRYDLDLGATRGGSLENPIYSRSRLCLTLGIAWKAWTKGNREAP
jgi:hypothetical protein